MPHLSLDALPWPCEKRLLKHTCHERQLSGLSRTHLHGLACGIARPLMLSSFQPTASFFGFHRFQLSQFGRLNSPQQHPKYIYLVYEARQQWHVSSVSQRALSLSPFLFASVRSLRLIYSAVRKSWRSGPTRSVLLCIHYPVVADNKKNMRTCVSLLGVSS